MEANIGKWQQNKLMLMAHSSSFTDHKVEAQV